jgi:hypothetical protein
VAIVAVVALVVIAFVLFTRNRGADAPGVELQPTALDGQGAGGDTATEAPTVVVRETPLDTDVPTQAPTDLPTALPTAVVPTSVPTSAATAVPPTPVATATVAWAVEFYPDNGQYQIPEDQRCIAVNWQTQGVTDLYLEREGFGRVSVPATGREANICFGEDEITYHLHFKLPDGTEQHRTIRIERTN